MKGSAGTSADCASKNGVEGIMQAAAIECAPFGIRVNTVAPGLVKSEITRKLWESEAAAAMSSQMHALGRLGEPDDIAKAVAWLLDPENSWITGQTISVDGGLGSIMPRMKA